MAPAGFQKVDRSARLLRALLLFQESPAGLTSADLSRLLGVSRRTAQREILALERWVGARFHQAGTRWVLPAGSCLGPLAFTLPEAMGLLLAARLMARGTDHADSDTATAYHKMVAHLPEPIRQPMADTAFTLETKPASPARELVMRTLTEA